MAQAVATRKSSELNVVPGEKLEDFVTFIVKDQMFGIPVLKVQDILTPDRIASIPLAPAEVRGAINLRGRIVTVIDVRVRLGVEKLAENLKGMGVTVEQDNDLYTLLVDKVGDVVSMSRELYEGNPSTLDPLWRQYAIGVYRLKDNLMVILDVERLLNIKGRKDDAINKAKAEALEPA